MPQSFSAIYLHTVFSTKHREPYLTPEILPRVCSYIGGIIKNQRSHLLAANGIADHLHLLISLSRDRSIADTLREIKSSSSGWIHEEFLTLRHFSWQTGYSTFSVSHSNLDAVRTYIANQESHHRAMTFKEELIGLLKRHDIPYDERYIWE